MMTLMYCLELFLDIIIKSKGFYRTIIKAILFGAQNTVYC